MIHNIFHREIKKIKKTNLLFNITENGSPTRNAYYCSQPDCAFKDQVSALFFILIPFTFPRRFIGSKWGCPKDVPTFPTLI